MSPTNPSRSRHSDLMFVVLLITPALASPAWAQRAADSKPPAVETIVRTYDITELTHTGRDHPYDSSILPPTRLLATAPSDSTSGGGGQGLFSGGQGGQGLFPGDEGKRPRPLTEYGLAEEVRLLIQGTIQPESWRANGGVVGDILFFRNKLIIRHTADTHEQIDTLLLGLRLRPVTVRAKWLRLSGKQLASITVTEGQHVPQWLKPETLARAIDDDASIVAYEGQTTCLSGQTVHLASGHGRSYLTAADPVVGNNAAGYIATTKMAQLGAILQIRPILTEGKAVVDLQSVVSNDVSNRKAAAIQVGSWSGQNPTGGDAAGMFHIAPIDRVDLAIQHFGTTLKVPLNTPVLVGGMTMPGGPEGQSTPLYLVLEIVSEQ